ncbi:MAG: HAMP domain-containing sensor histidine kinase [Elusimicrobia bacterium]|nr:HAMP domain-containing sensor histidine kinase [Elusimicrobiota bacterium]
MIALAVLLGMKARSRYWFYMLNGLTLLSISSFAIGFNATMESRIQFQECGWVLGLLSILAAQTYPLRDRPHFARWNSLRVRLVWFVCLITAGVLLLLYVLQAFVAKDLFHLTSSLFFIVFGVWFVANLISFRVSEDIHALMDGLEAPQSPTAAPGFRLTIYEAELFAEKLRKAYDTIKSQSRLSALSQLSAQVAHDIRSPLAALDSALKDVSQLPENKRLLIRGAAGRIRDIANGLLEKNRQTRTAAGQAEGGPSAGQPEAYLLSSLIEPVITEKRLQFRDSMDVAIEADLGPDSYGLFAKVRPVEFSRMLSNLINNGVEALDRGGSVILGLSHEKDRIAITVRDDGRGIPPEILARLGQMGETHGKAGGSGLGLFHARTTVESWGGSLALCSEAGKGTTLTLTLPQAAQPAWFVQELVFRADSHVVILDDDTSIHQVWKGLFESARLKERGIDVISFSAPEMLRQWVGANPAAAEDAVYLVDYELLGHKETGLDLAGELKIAGKAIMVTSRYEEPYVMQGCRKLGMRLIPKNLVGLVPVSVSEKTKKSPWPAGRQAALLDDDDLVNFNWKMAARSAGIELKTYKNAGEFLLAAETLSKDTPVYIDSELGEGVSGADIAKELHQKGFSDITMATGHGPKRFEQLSWLKVSGKEPPWDRKP